MLIFFIYIGSLVIACLVIAYLFHALIVSKNSEFALLLKEKDRVIADQESIKKSYQEIAADAVESAKTTLNYYRDKEGAQSVAVVGPVVSESHSPSTAAQRETANIQTLRATMAAIRITAGQTPRAEPEHAEEEK